METLNEAKKYLRQSLSQAILSAKEEAKAEERNRCLEALPKKRKSSHDGHEIDDYYCIQCGKGVKQHPEHIYGFNSAIDQAISAISNKKNK